MQVRLALLTQKWRSTRGVWFDYLSLTKPRVLSLLLLTTLASMLIAEDYLPRPATIIFTLLGGYLAAGGASALNCYLDRYLDAEMIRTRQRPLPAGRLRPEQGLYFGLILSGASFFVLWLGTTLLAAYLALGGIFYYVFIYTYWLKRRSVHSIVIGGAAGAIPALVGWAAVTGSLSPMAFFLFAIIFYWTPPHFWSLSLLIRDDYARAKVPMFPVIYGDQATRSQILLYTIPLIILTILPVAFDFLGPFYLVSAFLLGIIFIYEAWQVWRTIQLQPVRRLFRYSLIYLALLFVAMVIDQVGPPELPHFFL